MNKKNLKGHPRFYALLETIADLHSRKNQNYADDKDPLSNLKECEKFGVPAFLGTIVRLSDKWSRIQQLTNGKKDLVGESLKDTLMDMSIYALLAIVLLEEQENLTKQK